MVRVDEDSGLGVALATDSNGRFTRLDPYAGAQLALAEAHRNVVVSGARPVAVSDCLNFGSPEEPGVMWQFAEAVRGLAHGCRDLGIPVTGGNVSLYNQTGTTPILPTPVVAVLGVIDDVRQRIRTGFPAPGMSVFLLGETREELSGSEWAHVVHEHLGGYPPSVDLGAELALGRVMGAAAAAGIVAAAHDLADGGLAQALVEACLRHGTGVRVRLEDDPFLMLFSESTARAVVALRPEREADFEALCAEHGVPLTSLGETWSEPALEVVGEFRIPLEELRAAWSAPIPAALATSASRPS
jgi:phosphoribosylformylglycinamidine synthase